jgi:cupin 2 domain-containing protein
MNDLPPGRYRHFKGNEYTVLGLSRHSETHEELVVYRQEYGDHGLWVRPKAMFMETVMVDGQEVPRFQHLSSKDGDKNLFADLPPHLPQELVQTLLTATSVRIERIVSHGHASPEGFWYDQDQDEWVVVLKGAARLQFECQIVEMGPGDYINIPAHQRHRVEWTTPVEPTIWLAVHYGEGTRSC